LARGLEIGLPQSSPQVRKAIVQELIQSILAEVSSEAFDDVELRQFYQDNMAYFTSPPRTQLRRLVFRDRGETSAQALAEEGWQQLQQGQSFARVRERFAAEDPLPLPAEPLPDHKLLQYLGPSQTAIARQMQAGAYSRPIAAGANRVILQVLHKQAMAPGAFADIRDRVAAEYERRRGDQALAAYLQQLRQQADIAIDDAFLDSIAPAPPTSAAEN
jgi:hypothetical protein